jgi:hypothetical protein
MEVRVRFVNRVGQKFGRLTVVARAPGRFPGEAACWICDCDCGKQHIVSCNYIKKTKSCGCIRKHRPLGMESLTQARLKELLCYEPETGEFFWRINKSNGMKAGDRAGCIGGRAGHWYITVDGKNYLGHRLAWLYVYGQFPNGPLDHKNRNPASCRIADLRRSTHGQNRANSKVNMNNRSGLKGVRQRGRRWIAAASYNGKRVHFGTYDTPELAHAVYCYAAKRLFGEFFCNGKD